MATTERSDRTLAEAYGADILVNSNNDVSIIQALENLDLQPQPAPRLSLLGLPAELRLRIYDFLPVPQVPPEPDCSAAQCLDLSIPNAFAILHTSRQIHTEAKPVLYAHIEVQTTHLKHVPPHAKQYIRSAIISARARYDAKGVPLSRSTSKLWCCDPALTQFSLTNNWPLENMFRYLARAWPAIQHLRIREEDCGAWPGIQRLQIRDEDGGTTSNVQHEGELPESAAKKAKSNAVMPHLRRVVIQDETPLEYLELFRHVRPCPRIYAQLFALKEEVERLSAEAIVVWEQPDLGFGPLP